MLGLAQSAHSMEEMGTCLYDFFWIATGWLHARVSVVPQFRMSPQRFAMINMAIIAVLLGSVPFVSGGRRWAIALAWVAAVIEILNGTGHLAGTLVFGGYVPGAATAPLLLLTGILLLTQLVRTGR